jgi:putative endonuclease
MKLLMMFYKLYILKIKKWTRAKKEALISGNFDMLQILAEWRNATHFKYFDK